MTTITIYGPAIDSEAARQCAGAAVDSFLGFYADRPPRVPVGYRFTYTPPFNVTVWRTRGGNVTAYVYRDSDEAKVQP